MNAAHWHIMLNHIPVLGTFFVLLLLIIGMARKSQEVIRLAVVGFVVVAVITLPVFFLGDAAAEQIATLPGISADRIAAHDDAAGKSLTAALILGGLCLAGLIVFRGPKRVPMAFAAVVLALSLVVGIMMGWTANLGGQIRHPEIIGSGQAGGPIRSERSPSSGLDAQSKVKAGAETPTPPARP